MSEFTTATNEIELWAKGEEICDLFGVEDENLAGDFYIRRFKGLNTEDEFK